MEHSLTLKKFNTNVEQKKFLELVEITVVGRNSKHKVLCSLGPSNS